MKRMKFVFFSLLFFCLVANPSRGNDDHSNEQNKGLDEQPVHEEHVTESAGKELRLSPSAAKSFGIVISPVISKKDNFEIPRSALLEAQHGKYIYLDNAGIFIRTDVEVVKRLPDTILIRAKGLSEHSKIVTEGVPFLRAAELDLTTSGGDHH